MADYVQVPADGAGKKIDARSLDVGADTVMRQRIILADNSGTATFATVATGTPNAGDGGLVVRNIPSGTQSVDGKVAISGTAVVAGVVNISATASVVVGAGTANIGSINHISRTAQVAIGTPFTVNDISRTVQVAVQTPFTVNNISATVNVAGTLSLGGTVNIAALDVTDGTAVNVGDSANGALRVAIVAGGGGVASQVSLAAGTSNIGLLDSISKTVNVAVATPFTLQGISTTVQVAIATPFTVNAISATVAVTGTVALATDAILGSISRTVQVAIGTPFTINNISATAAITGTVALAADTVLGSISRTVQVAIGTPFTLQAISTTVTVAGNVNLSTMPAVNISVMPAVVVSGTATVTGDVFINAYPEQYSASRGPKCVTISTSAGVSLVAAPGAGQHVYVTMLAATNFSSTLTRADVFAASQTATCVAKMAMAASGGGFVMHFDPPVKLQSNTALTGRVKPSVSEAYFTVHFYVGP